MNCVTLYYHMLHVPASNGLARPRTVLVYVSMQLTTALQIYGPRNWSVIAVGVKGRSGKSCRLRWCNQLNPNVKKEPFSNWEDAVIIKAHKVSHIKPA